MLIKKNKLRLISAAMILVPLVIQGKPLQPKILVENCFISDETENTCWQQMSTEPNPAVYYDFGVHYANGDGVKQDFTKGRYWMHQAALKGFPLAQYNLGVMFFDGLGGTQSKECAVHWLNKSASEGGETREMAQQALAALSELALSAGMPKIYRVLTEEECEQLPEVVFPRGESEPVQLEETSDSQPSEADEVEQSQDAPDTLSPEADMISAHSFAEPGQAVQPLLIEPEPEPEPEPEAKSPPPTIFREKMGQYFIQLGHQLLGQDSSSEQDRVHHDMGDKPKVNYPGPVIVFDKEEVIAAVSVEPEPVADEAVISAPAEVLLPHDEPLFAEEAPEQSVETAHEPVDVMAISSDALEAEIPPESTVVEVAEPTVKPSETEEPEATLSLPADETGELTSPKNEETPLPAGENIVEPAPADALPVVIPQPAPEPTEVVAPVVPKIAPRVVEKAIPRTLNLGGALPSAPKGHYTLQLSSASQAEPLQVIAKKYKLSNYLVYETQRHGRDWYVLVYGEYAGMTQAKQALQQLPEPLKKYTPWIRSLAHVHSEL